MQFSQCGESTRLTLPSLDPLTLRELLSVPFPSELSAAPCDDRVAWVFNEAGCRNLWVCDVSGEPRALTTYRDDEGHGLQQPRWLPGGDGIVYTRGTLPGEEEPSFPATTPAGAIAPQIWLVPLDGGVPRLLGEGQSATVSPRGDRLAYLLNGQIWTVSLTDSVMPEPLVRDRGTCGSLAWSPDGSQLAFVSDRGDQTFIAVVDLASRSIRWISPGIDRDAFPTWSPDGGQIAFVRLADPVAPSYTARRCGNPWSLWIGDATSGVARCIWTASPGAGSVFAGLPSGPQLAWTQDGQIIFPWEGSGWRHLYAIPVAVCDAKCLSGDGEVRELTPGDFEVFEMSQDPSGHAIVCSANKEDLDRRHLWRIDLTTKKMSAVTSGLGIEVSPSVTGSGRVAALHADARTPLHPVWIAQDGRMWPTAPGSLGGCPSAQLVNPELVVFPSPDGLDIHAQLFLPPEDDARERHPAIVHFHGGPVRQMLPAWHPTEAYHLQYGMNQYLVSQGYVVLSVNYRGGNGYGLNFREPPELGAGGASEYQDILATARYLRGRTDVDAARIGVYGFSYGGLMTALALARSSDLFAAGVDCAGISDWSPAFAAAGTPPDALERAFDSSPIASVDQWRSPILFIHADDDRTVPFSQTIGIVKALRRQSGVHVEHIVIPDEQHDFLRHRSWERVFAATTDFFNRMFK